METILVVDHQERRLAFYGTQGESLERLREALHRLTSPPPPIDITFKACISDTEHGRRIVAAQEYISAGDIYQANITRRNTLRGELDPCSALSALHRLNPVMHSAYLRAGGVEILSNSMEDPSDLRSDVAARAQLADQRHPVAVAPTNNTTDSRLTR